MDNPSCGNMWQNLHGNCWFSDSSEISALIVLLLLCCSGRAINSYFLHQLEKALHGALFLSFDTSRQPPLCSVPSVPSWHVAEGLQNKAVCRALGVFGFSEQRSCRRPKLRWDWLTRDHILNSTNGDVEVAWNKVVRRYSTYFYDVLKKGNLTMEASGMIPGLGWGVIAPCGLQELPRIPLWKWGRKMLHVGHLTVSVCCPTFCDNAGFCLQRGWKLPVRAAWLYCIRLNQSCFCWRLKRRSTRQCSLYSLRALKIW